MGLEAGDGFISGLVATNPVGATDPKSQGDDHLRLIKVALKGTFPNLTGAMTATQAQINQTAVGTGGTFPAINGSALTALNASNIASGSLADARLSANVPLLNAANVFTGANRFTAAITEFGSGGVNTGGNLRLIDDTAATRWAMGVIGGLSDTSWFLYDLVAGAPRITVEAGGASIALAATAITLNGVAASDFARLSQANTFTNALQTVSGTSARWEAVDGAVNARLMADLSSTAVEIGAGSNHALKLVSNGLNRLEISNGGNFDFKAGTVTTNGSSASEVGTAGAPARSVSASGNTTATDRAIRFTGGSGQTFTLDGDPPTDAVIVIDNSGGAAWTLAASGTLIWAATAGTGSRTMADDSLAVAFHRGSGVWIVNGGGLS